MSDRGVRVTAHKPAILENSTLYIQEDSADTDLLSIELAKLFGNPKGLDDFIGLLLSKKTQGKIESFIRAKGIQELPEEEAAYATITETNQETEKEPETTEGTEEGSEKGQIPPAKPGEGTVKKPQQGPVEPPEYGGQEPKEWKQECEPEKAETKVEIYKGEPKLPVVTEPPPRILIPGGTDGPDRPKPGDNDNGDSTETKKKIGEWGEKYALKCIKNQLLSKYENSAAEETSEGFQIKQNGRTIATAKWLNKDDEIGVGRDIELTENGKKTHIEVKSTKNDDKEWFDVSRKQWEMIEAHGPNYTIYRVYNAGREKEAQLEIIENPKKLWAEGAITAYPVRIRI